jgi:hypothetical protein
VETDVLRSDLEEGPADLAAARTNYGSQGRIAGPDTCKSALSRGLVGIARSCEPPTASRPTSERIDPGPHRPLRSIACAGYYQAPSLPLKQKC